MDNDVVAQILQAHVDRSTWLGNAILSLGNWIPVAAVALHPVLADELGHNILLDPTGSRRPGQSGTSIETHVLVFLGDHDGRRVTGQRCAATDKGGRNDEPRHQVPSWSNPFLAWDTPSDRRQTRQHTVFSVVEHC